MVNFMQEVDIVSSNNLCHLLRCTVGWNPKVGEVINLFLESHSKVTLEGHLQLKNEFEIARSLDGYAAREIGKKLLHNLPSAFINGVDKSNKDLRSQLVALCKFVQDLRVNLSKVGPEFHYREEDGGGLQKKRILFESSRGILDDNEINQWKSNPQDCAYPFPTSGVLRSKDISDDLRLSAYRPIVIYFGIQNLMDRSIYTFMDAMQPPILTEHRKAVLNDPKHLKSTLPKGYHVGLYAGSSIIECQETPERLNQILPYQHLALSEALAVSWGLEQLPEELVHEADYVEAQVMGGVDLERDLQDIKVTSEVYNWILELLESRVLFDRDREIHEFLDRLICCDKLKSFALQKKK